MMMLIQQYAENFHFHNISICMMKIKEHDPSSLLLSRSYEGVYKKPTLSNLIHLYRMMHWPRSFIFIYLFIFHHEFQTGP